MDPESIMLSEINQTNTLYYHLYVNLKHQMNMYNKTETESDRTNQWLQVGERGGEGQYRCKGLRDANYFV